MGKYRLLKGTHRHGGKKYVAGDIIDTEDNLERIKNKFERLDTLVLDEPDDDDTGDTDTAKFSLVKSGRRWEVVNADGDAQHEGNLSKNKATELLSQLLAD